MNTQLFVYVLTVQEYQKKLNWFLLLKRAGKAKYMERTGL